MKQREPRRRVLIPARMKSATEWRDACIVNLSSRGALVRSSDSPTRGDYLELRRGSHIIVARVMWSEDGECGVKAQDWIAVEALVANHDPVVEPVTDDGRRVDRRAVQRRTNDDGAEASRWLGQACEYGVVALLGAAAAVFASQTVSQVLSQPMAEVEQAMANQDIINDP